MTYAKSLEFSRTRELACFPRRYRFSILVRGRTFSNLKNGMGFMTRGSLFKKVPEDKGEGSSVEKQTRGIKWTEEKTLGAEEVASSSFGSRWILESRKTDF